MNISGINYESINDGYGVRAVIYVSGCSHECPNCHNPETHDINYGIDFTNDLLNEIIDNIKKRPFVSGITLSGGDPLHENNVFHVYHFIKRLKSEFPNKNIWLYTGYKWEHIMYPIVTDNFDLRREKIINYRKEITKMCDVVVDGKYIDYLRDITLKFCGSSNQRIIDVQESLKQNKIILWEQK